MHDQDCIRDWLIHLAFGYFDIYTSDLYIIHLGYYHRCLEQILCAKSMVQYGFSRMYSGNCTIFTATAHVLGMQTADHSLDTWVLCMPN